MMREPETCPMTTYEYPGYARSGYDIFKTTTHCWYSRASWLLAPGDARRSTRLAPDRKGRQVLLPCVEPEYSTSSAAGSHPAGPRGLHADVSR